MRFGLSTPSFSSAHAEAARDPDPRTPAGLAELASSWDLEAIELSARWFDDQPPDAVDQLAADAAAKCLTVVIDTSGSAEPEGIARNVHAALELAHTTKAAVVRTTISQCLEGDRSRYGLQGWKDHLSALVAPLTDAAKHAADVDIPFGI